MKKKVTLTFMITLATAMTLTTACSTDDELFDEYYDSYTFEGDSNETSFTGGSSSSPYAEMKTFTVNIDKTTAEPSSTAAAQSPADSDAPAANTFATIVNIDMANPTDPAIDGVTMTIDGNGDMYLKGGTIIACGANGAEAGIDINEQKKLYISGSNIFAIGGRVDGNLGSTTQGIVTATGSLSANSTLTVSDGSKTLCSFSMPPVSYSGNNTIIISSPNLTSGSSYTLTAGSSSVSVTATNTISGGMGGGRRF